MKKAFEDMLLFHVKNKSYIGKTPSVPNEGTAELRRTLIEEEFEELMSALSAGDLPGIADSIADLCYVLIGTAVSYGIYLPAVWDAVQKSNMTKDGGHREDGKVMKGDSFKHPDIVRILNTQIQVGTVAKYAASAGAILRHAANAHIASEEDIKRKNIKSSSITITREPICIGQEDGWKTFSVKDCPITVVVNMQDGERCCHIVIENVKPENFRCEFTEAQS